VAPDNDIYINGPTGVLRITTSARHVYKSTDGGRNWRHVLNKGPDVGAVEVVIDPADSQVVYAGLWNTRRPPWFTYAPTNGPGGGIFKSADGGATWTAVYSRRMPQGGWTSTGLDVTTNYGIHFDPFEMKRQFITYTDVGLFRSEDSGKSWVSSTTGVPAAWLNTTYWMVFDPDVRGRVWSVNSGTHDLPRPKMWRNVQVLNYKGGVCRSDDGGKTWVKSNSGMDETAATHILLDARSSSQARTLYVAAFGRGVYKSTDGGTTWSLKNSGIAQIRALVGRLDSPSLDRYRLLPYFSGLLYKRQGNPFALELCIDAEGRVVEAIVSAALEARCSVMSLP